jgi:5-methylcytosine-specific restriction endonuclease McrA
MLENKKQCSSCKEIKSLSGFHKNKAKKDGYNNQCKKCRKEYYYTYPELPKLRAKQWRENNLDRYKKNIEARKEEIKKYNKQYHKAWRKSLAKFESYGKLLSLAEVVRDQKGTLEIKCNYCGKWFAPTNSDCHNRIAALEKSSGEERRLYCSRECKIECPIYRKILWPAGYRRATSREVQPDLRQLVFKRDGYDCQICGNCTSLHCHHITGVEQNPIESADIDNCVTLCKKCHKYVHSKEGCRYYDFRCKKKDGEKSVVNF